MSSSLERSSSHSGGTIANEYAMRLELATERQKRQIAEERLRHVEEKNLLHQSGTSLLSAAVSERQAADEACERLRSSLDELREDNELLASVVEQLRTELKGANELERKQSAELDNAQWELRRTRAELQQVQANKEILEDKLSNDAQQLAMLASALGEKNASLADLQVHFKSLTEKLRSANEERVVLLESNQTLSRSLVDLQEQSVARAHAQECMLMVHNETSRRFAMMLMQEEVVQDLLYRQWHDCAHNVIVTLESDIDTIGQAWREARQELDASQSALERAISETQLRRGTPKATQSDMTMVHVEETCRELEDTVSTLRRVDERNELLECTCRELEAELASRKEALGRLQSRRKTPSVHALGLPAAAEPTVSVNTTDTADRSTIEAMFHRGEALVLKQRMEAMMQRMMGQTHEYEDAMRENERLKDELTSLRLQLSVHGNGSSVVSRVGSSPLMDALGAVIPQHQRDDETARMLEALEKRVDLAERQLRDAKQRIVDVEGERDRALRETSNVTRRNASLKLDVESYQTSLDDLKTHVQQLESTRIPRDIHEQQLQFAQASASDVSSRCDAALKQLAEERKRRVELEQEVDTLKSRQSLTALQDSNKALMSKNEALIQEVDTVREELTRHFEGELAQRDEMIADAAKRLMEASDELDSAEYERQSLRRECNALRGRVEAMLSLQERASRALA
jgi:hypothetical protein